MPITSATETWLSNAGYKYHCFISWAHTPKNKEMTSIARRIKLEIEASLALSIPNPRVFLDESEIKGGAIWQQQLADALCHSLVMVAICAPIYYHPEHRWCGIEWAAMDQLSIKRFPNNLFKAIIPVILKNDFLPQEITEIQYIDLSHLIIRGRVYFRTNDFRNKINEIVQRVEQIATIIAENHIYADCEGFLLPSKPAFLDYHFRRQPFPFHEI